MVGGDVTERAGDALSCGNAHQHIDNASDLIKAKSVLDPQ
jgi:hypothetical protein